MYSARSVTRWHSTSSALYRSPISAIQRRPSARYLSSTARRHDSSQAGDNESGHIDTTSQEGLFFFDNLFPLKIQWLTRIPFINTSTILRAYKRGKAPGLALSDPSTIIHRALPENLPIKVLEILPRIREGGAYVKFQHEQAVSAAELEGTVKQYLREKPITPWFNPFRRVRAFVVVGKPWIEDLYRLPSQRLKVEFLPTVPEAGAVELTQETLYSLFRKYGPILEMISQPSDSKIMPRYAYIDFARVRFATMAKNCMHGFVLGTSQGGGKTGTLLKLSYEPRAKSHWFRDWITNHPRIVIPIIAALIAAASVTVFDPIRTFSIRMHITHGLHLEENKYYVWIMKQLTRGYDYIRFNGNKRQSEEGLKALWADRHAQIEQLRTWMSESVDTFIIIQGPRGAGKRQLINEALADQPNKLIIDCKRIQEARGDTKKINAAANEVGYRPVFSWMNSLSSLIDLAAMGTIGMKTGFSETMENQLTKIWSNTAAALRQIALGQRKQSDRDFGLQDDEWLEAHPEMRPVVILDNFLQKGVDGSGDMIYEKMSEWAAQLTTQNVAHVVFLTTDVSFSKVLSKALPDRVFRQMALGDCSPEVAKKVVIKHLEAGQSLGSDDAEAETLSKRRIRNDLDELDSVIATLGGRLTDLEFLARRIQAGESPGSAVNQIIQQSASEILKMYLLDNERSWTPQQAWYLVREIASNEELRYNEVLLNDLFAKNGEGVLQALEQADLISVTSANGRPKKIRPGKPVYLSAFQLLTEDQVLKARFDLSIISQTIKKENEGLQGLEQELDTLGKLPGTPAELKPRIKYLLGKAGATQERIVKLEEKAGRLKKILVEQY